MPWSAYEICEAYAEKRNYHTKKGRPDTHRAGLELLKLVCDGYIVFYATPSNTSINWSLYQHNQNGSDNSSDTTNTNTNTTQNNLSNNNNINKAQRKQEKQAAKERLKELKKIEQKALRSSHIQYSDDDSNEDQPQKALTNAFAALGVEQHTGDEESDSNEES